MKDIYEGSKRHNLLNGKCLEAFLEWYRDVYSIEHDINDNGWSVNYMPFQMAYGVYLEFFDSVDIIIDNQPIIDYNKNSYTDVLYWIINIVQLRVEQKEDEYHFTKYLTRKEAQEKSIIEANEIYNINFGNKS